jgi:hypothetical protein
MHKALVSADPRLVAFARVTAYPSISTSNVTMIGMRNVFPIPERSILPMGNGGVIAHNERSPSAISTSGINL